MLHRTLPLTHRVPPYRTCLPAARTAVFSGLQAQTHAIASTRNTLSYSSFLPHQLCSSFPRSLENGMSLWGFLCLSSWGVPAVHALPLLCPLVLCCSSVSCSLHLPQAWAETSRVLSAACPSHWCSLAEQRMRHDLSMCLGCPHTSRPVVPKIMSRGSHLLTL